MASWRDTLRTPPRSLSSRRRGDVDAAMVAICREDTPRLLDDTSFVDEFVAAVRHHRIAPLSHVALRDDAPEVAALLKPDRDLALSVNMQSEITLGQLEQVLGDIPWATFKGLALSEHAHPAPGLRTFRDLDVLVAPDRLRDATTQLAAAGWTHVDHDQMLRLTDTAGEMHWVSPAGLLVDLHWAMINMATVRHRHRMMTEELLARRQRVPLGLAPSVPVLDPTDALVHACMHAGLSGGQRLLWMVDLDQLTRRDVEWDLVAERARRWGAHASVALVLQRAQRMLGTPLPSDLNRRLGMSRAFRVVTATADRISPVSRLRRDESIAKLVSRAARPSATETLTTIVRHTATGVTTRVFRRGTDTVGQWRPPTDDGLETYLRGVEREVGRRRTGATVSVDR